MTPPLPNAGGAGRGRRFKLTAFVTPETDLHAAVAHALDVMLLPPAIYTTLPIGHVQLTGQQAAKFARLGVKRNWPDVICLYAGQFHGIELKRVGGRLSRTRTVRTRKGALRVVDGQEEGFERLRQAGMVIHVCESVDSVLDALRGAGVPIRGWS
jgi:hypothetical protein